MGKQSGCADSENIGDRGAFSTRGVVELAGTERQFIICTIKRQKYKLDELVYRITDENIHKEDIWGPAVGREVW